jgi:hypothetical protein
MQKKVFRAIGPLAIGGGGMLSPASGFEKRRHSRETWEADREDTTPSSKAHYVERTLTKKLQNGFFQRSVSYETSQTRDLRVICVLEVTENWSPISKSHWKP